MPALYHSGSCITGIEIAAGVEDSMAQTYPACGIGGCRRCSQPLSPVRCSINPGNHTGCCQSSTRYGVMPTPLLRLFLLGDGASTAATTLEATLRLPGVEQPFTAASDASMRLLAASCARMGAAAAAAAARRLLCRPFAAAMAAMGAAAVAAAAAAAARRLTGDLIVQPLAVRMAGEVAAPTTEPFAAPTAPFCSGAAAAAWLGFSSFTAADLALPALA